MSPRTRRALAAVVAVLLAVVLLGALLLLGDRPVTDQTPEPTSSPTLRPSPASQPTPDPTASPSPPPEPSPTASPSPTQPASPLPPTTTPVATSPSPSPTSQPTGPPGADQREIRLTGLGLDRQGLEEARERLLTVEIDGPGAIEFELTRVSSGSVRACTWQGTPGPVGARECERIRRGGGLSRQVSAVGRSSWTISLIGAGAQASPTISFSLRFPSDTGNLALEGFRLQGQDLEGYNGFDTRIETTSAGTLALSGTIDDGAGGEYPFRVTVAEAGALTGVEAEGIGGSFELETELESVGAYRVNLEGSLGIADQEVLLRARLSWP